MSAPLAGVRALLIDLEGTVIQGGRLLPGAAAAVDAARSSGIVHAFVTNTTSRPRSALVRELSDGGLTVEPERIFSAPRAALAHLRRRGTTRCRLLLRPALREEFPGIACDADPAEAVVLGDLGAETTYDRLNDAFRRILDGAELIALARNRYWRGEGGLMLDVGAFAAALEYASGRPATLVGKPAREFFDAALSWLDVPASEAAVIGDDLDSDVRGGQEAGLRGVLVRTGKYREGDLEASAVRPDAVLDSLADLPRLL